MNLKEAVASVTQSDSLTPQTTHGRNPMVLHYHRLMNTMIKTRAYRNELHTSTPMPRIKYSHLMKLLAPYAPPPMLITSLFTLTS